MRRTEQRARWTKAGEDIKSLDAEIAALRQSIPAVDRGKSIATLTVERDGVAKRIALYAEAPVGLLRRETALAAAIASRQALDQAGARRETLRDQTATPPPDADLPQIAYLARLAAMLGWNVGKEQLNALLSVVFVLTLKFASITGFGIVGVSAASALQASNARAWTFPRLRLPSWLARPAPVVSVGASPAPSAAPTNAVPPSAPQNAPTIASLLRAGLNGRGAPPHQP
jgi:hypothetical protein